MYAIIKDGGKQYQVAPGSIVQIEQRVCDPGTNLEFSEVVYYHNKNVVKIGEPTVPNMKVKGVVEKHLKGDKLFIFHYRRRKDSRKKNGHRQMYTRVRILEIVGA